MMKVSGFTFCHNAIDAGIPIMESVMAVRPFVDEVVAVDLDSTDRTKEILNKICERVLSMPWNGRDTTPNAFLRHTECRGDIIIFFEADEVYSESLLKEVQWYLARDMTSLAVYRIQLEQNFQRCREYPIPVHRIFPKGQGSYHIHPTIIPAGYNVEIIPPDMGYLWDCSNNFRENWLHRKLFQSQIWGESRHLMVASHFTLPNEISEEEEIARLHDPHWTVTASPFNLPAILKSLVGKVRYEVSI